MDFLVSLGLGNALPEQSTRLMSHPGIVKALENNSSGSTDCNDGDGDGDDGVVGDDGVRLGFNHCLTCGIRLFANSNNNNDEEELAAVVGVTCKGCGRVKYCSKACRIEDANPTTTSSMSHHDNNIDGDGCEDGDGHSPVVCSLLRLCNDDEDAEDELFGIDEARQKKKMMVKKKMTLKNASSSYGSESNDERSSSSWRKGGSSRTSTSSSSQKEAAMYRVQTERESYPATLFNILSEGPDWFVESITRRLRCNVDVRSPIPEERKKQQQQQKRRGKRERSSLSPKVSATTGKRERDELSEEGDDVRDGGAAARGSKKRELVLHIVGASIDSELWGWDMRSSNGGGGSRKNDDVNEEDIPVLNAYAEASTNLSSYLKNLLEISSITIRCVFIGPDCPDAGKGAATSSSSAVASHVVQIPIPDESSSTLTMETYRCKYGGRDQPYLPYPDVIVFFNPGFSCPDYDWSVALSAAMAYQYSSTTSGAYSGSAIPFLITTNTEMEGLADIKYLLDGGYVDEKTLSRDVLEMIDQPQATNGEGAQHADAKKYDDDRVTSFFGENPYAGLRVRQSGTMANDLYVKNRWIIGGLFHTVGSGSGRGVARGGNGRQEQQSSKKRKTGIFNPEDYRDEYEEEGRIRETKACKLRHRAEGQSGPKDCPHNEKRKNPALI